jgi:hypothetical protein
MDGEMSDWQPIESAPRDGTPVIGWFPDYGKGRAWTTWFPVQDVGGGRNNWWWYEHTAAQGDVPQPTHWRPLDPP